MFRKLITLLIALIMFIPTFSVIESNAASVTIKRPAYLKIEVKRGVPTVSWREVNGADGYRIYRKIGSSGKWVKVKTTKKATFTDKDIPVTEGKVSYRLKAYTKIKGKTVWSKYSSAKSVKIEPETPLLTDAEILERFYALKDKYPEGMKWGYDKQYNWESGRIVGSPFARAGTLCSAFAMAITDDVFGITPVYEHFDASKIRVGDEVGIKEKNADYSHSVVVLAIDGSILTCVESGGTVHWASQFDLNECEFLEVFTRVPID